MNYDDDETGTPDQGGSRDFVQSLARGLKIITSFGSDSPAMTVTELAEAAGMTRAATRRFLLTLVDLGYVVSDGHRYSLTSDVLRLGYSYLSSITLPEIAAPHLDRLVSLAGESSEGAILSRDEIVYVVRVAGPSVMTATVNIGARMPAFATALGRVLLAGLNDDELDGFLQAADLPAIRPQTITDPERLRAELLRVRAQGWAVVDQELEAGLVAVAVPIRDRTGRPVAAINLSTHIGRKSVDDLLTCLPDLQAAATDIEKALAASVTGTLTFR